MKIELLRSIHWGGTHRDAGEVIEVTQSDASGLIANGKATPYAEPQSPVVNRAVELEVSEAPKTIKRTYKKKG
jgi:hypothetical protein